MIAILALSSVLYGDVPPDVVSISARRWRAGAAPITVNVAVSRSGDRVILTGAEEGLIVVYFERADSAYLIDGPFEWPRGNAHRPLDPRWRKTRVGTSFVPVPERVPLHWIARETDGGSVWPSCYWISDDRWECSGVPLDTSGVLVGSSGTKMLSTVVVSTGRAEPLRISHWGRLLVVTDEGAAPPSRLRIVAQQAIAPVQRPGGIRLETAAIADVTVTAVDPGAAWVRGRASPPAAWLDVRSARGGPVYVPLGDASEGPPWVPLHLTLPDVRVVSGTVTSAGGVAAGNTLLTTFRLIEAVRATDRSAPKLRRVLVAETLAAADGTFDIADTGDADYEIVAWHPQYGRATVSIPRGSASLMIRLQNSGVARGRLLSGGKPIASVDVISVPDPSAFQAAEDLLDVKGGDTRTSSDGRFSVALAAGGGGELRVGGGAYPIRRIPLPRVPLPLVDLGDIDLGVSIQVSVVLDFDPGCRFRAIGPVGRSGLQIVEGERTAPGIFRIALPEEGTWAFSLLCGGAERPVEPSMFQATAASQGKEVRVIVR